MVCMTASAPAQQELKTADAELNTLYKDIQRRLADNSDMLRLLTSAQRAWIAFRDAECGFSSAEVQGGSAYPQVVAACRAGLTQRRIEDFKAYLNCEEGDLGCPVPNP